MPSHKLVHICKPHEPTRKPMPEKEYAILTHHQTTSRRRKKPRRHNSTYPKGSYKLLNIKKMKNINYYFLFFASEDIIKSERWDDFQIDTTASIIVNDILDLREQHEVIRKQLMDDFKTIRFLVVKRIFIHDAFNEETGGIFHLYLEPVFD